MKISPRTVRDKASERAAVTLPLPPPLRIDERGLAWCVLMAPDTDSAWLALCDRGGERKATLAARMTACLTRLDEVAPRIAKGLTLIGDATRAGQAVPVEWIRLLGDLVVEEVEATWLFDELASQMAALGVAEWVESAPPPGDDPVGDRISRVITRTTQAYGGMNAAPTAEVAGILEVVDEQARAGAVAGVQAACVQLLRSAIGVRYAAPAGARGAS